MSYLPVGFIASKVGRKKTILAGIVILGSAFLCASFIHAGSSSMIMNVLFAAAGIGWATINVNSYPMVVELSRGGIRITSKEKLRAFASEERSVRKQ